MWSTNPIPSSHRVLFGVLRKILMQDDIWAVFRDKEQKRPEKRRNGALNKTPKKLRKFAHMVLTALAWSSYLSDQLWRKAPMNRTANSLCDTFWCLMSPVRCPQSRTHLAQHHASAIGQIQTCDLVEIWFEDCQESNKRGAVPWKMALQEPGVGAVLVGMVSPVPHRRQVLWLQWPSSGAGPSWGWLGQQRPCYPQSSYRKLQKSFKGDPF